MKEFDSKLLQMLFNSLFILDVDIITLQQSLSPEGPEPFSTKKHKGHPEKEKCLPRFISFWTTQLAVLGERLNILHKIRQENLSTSCSSLRTGTADANQSFQNIISKFLGFLMRNTLPRHMITW